MRKFMTIVAALLLSVATFAQAPQGFSYQAVVRDAQNAIVANHEVEVTLTITAEIDGVALQTYTENHSVTTNANGLLTLIVGQGESNQKLSDIKWNMPNAIYLKSDSSSQQLCDYIRAIRGIGKFLIVEITANRQGYLSKESWNFIRMQSED